MTEIIATGIASIALIITLTCVYLLWKLGGKSIISNSTIVVALFALMFLMFFADKSKEIRIYNTLCAEVDLHKVPTKGKAIARAVITIPYDDGKRVGVFLETNSTKTRVAPENQIGEEKSDEK